MITKCTYCEHERGKQKENHSLFISHIVQWPIVLVAREDFPSLNSTHFGRGTNCLDFSGDLGSTGSQAPLKSAD